MEKKIMKIKSCVISGQRNLKENICRFFTERKYISGITVIELVLILVIVIALLLIFKTELINLINSIHGVQQPRAKPQAGRARSCVQAPDWTRHDKGRGGKGNWPKPRRRR